MAISIEISSIYKTFISTLYLKLQHLDMNHFVVLKCIQTSLKNKLVCNVIRIGQQTLHLRCADYGYLTWWGAAGPCAGTTGGYIGGGDSADWDHLYDPLPACLPTA